MGIFQVDMDIYDALTYLLTQKVFIKEFILYEGQ